MSRIGGSRQIGGRHCESQVISSVPRSEDNWRKLSNKSQIPQHKSCSGQDACPLFPIAQHKQPPHQQTTEKVKHSLSFRLVWFVFLFFSVRCMLRGARLLPTHTLSLSPPHTHTLTSPHFPSSPPPLTLTLSHFLLLLFGALTHTHTQHTRSTSTGSESKK